MIHFKKKKHFTEVFDPACKRKFFEYQRNAEMNI